MHHTYTHLKCNLTPCQTSLQTEHQFFPYKAVKAPSALKKDAIDSQLSFTVKQSFIAVSFFQLLICSLTHSLTHAQTTNE